MDERDAADRQKQERTDGGTLCVSQLKMDASVKPQDDDVVPLSQETNLRDVNLALVALSQVINKEAIWPFYHLCVAYTFFFFLKIRYL